MDFVREGISTTERAKRDVAQSLGLSNVDDADKVGEPEGEAALEPNPKFTMWDV